MALHFLDHGFALPDHNKPGTLHGVELFEQAGQRHLRVWVGGLGQGQALCMDLTKAQALALADAAQELAARISE